LNFGENCKIFSYFNKFSLKLGIYLAFLKFDFLTFLKTVFEKISLDLATTLSSLVFATEKYPT